MAVTRKERLKQQEECLKYIMEEILDEAEDSNIAKSLKNHKCNNVYELVGLSDQEIKALDFKNNEGDIVELKIFEISKLYFSQEYFKRCKSEGHVFKTTEDFKSLEYDNFMEFCITYNIPSAMVATTSSSNTSSKPTTSSSLRDFMKDTKRI